MTMVPFLICELKKEALSNLVKECFGSDFPDILKKQQIDYVFRYLDEFIVDQEKKESAILLEFEYVDKDYIDDYAKFYARQFSNRGHKCARMHFFSKKIQHDQIDALLKGTSEPSFIKTLQENYLGFMVIKPLPRTFIGKTCLKVYPDIKDVEGAQSEKFVLTRDYDVSLFGIELKVSSIGFQEQDKVVSACATTAIWSVLHAMRWVSLSTIPSHSQITTDAINFIPGSSNSFPSKELSVKQILRAFDVMGFRHHAEYANNVEEEYLGTFIESYVASGYPVLLVGGIASDEDGLTGNHAVTVLGYKNKEVNNDSPLEALYVHDDRFGPFARASFGKSVEHESDVNEKESAASKFVLKLQRKVNAKWEKAHEFMMLQTYVVATPRNVRVPLLAVRGMALTIRESWKKTIFSGMNVSDTKEIDTLTLPKFTYRLRQINDIKREFRDNFPMLMVDGRELNNTIDEAAASLSRLKFLTKSFARFQWDVSVSYEGTEMFRILIDATDIPQGDAVSAILYRQEMAAILGSFQRLAISSPSNTNKEDTKPPSSFYISFLKRLKPPPHGLVDHLDRTYGSLRAPRYIKTTEINVGSELTQNQSRKIFYEPTALSIEEIFPDQGKKTLIWVINLEGALVIGIEDDGVGHPALTGSKPARIAGELHKKEKSWDVNDWSGRYSGDYSNRAELLKNAVARFNAYFKDNFSPAS